MRADSAQLVDDTTFDAARPTAIATLGVLGAFFFLSGASALLYQVVWERALALVYGSNVESVTLVIAASMLGLGLGSLSGGWLAERFPS